MYKTVIKSVLLYRFEMIALKSEERNVKVAEVHFLRWIAEYRLKIIG